MMKSLDLYLARAVFVGVVATLLIICAVDWLGDVFYQVGRMKDGDKFSDLLVLSLLNIPHNLFEFLPSSMLIGTLFSLGMFAATSELVAVSAGGYSRLRVGAVSCAAGLLISVALSVFIEVYAPYGEKLAASLSQQHSNNVLQASDESYWVRDKNRFIRVGQAVSQDLLNDVEIYQFNADGDIEEISQAQSAIQKPAGWQLQGYRSSRFAENKVTTNTADTLDAPATYFNNLLQSVTSDPDKMSLQRLTEYIFYLDENHLDSRAYQVALFKRLAVPFVGLAMLLLALPLVFRPRQSGGAGQRLLIGIILALVIYIVVEAIANGAVVYQFSPIVVAFLPVLIILSCAVAAFRLVR